MRTRTLLLLAVACGLVILVAGVVQLMRIAAQDEPAPAAPVGEPVEIGDLAVTVEDFAESGGRAVVELALGGVDDPEGTSEFRLVVPGASLRPVSTASGACGGTTVEAQRCTLTFDVTDTDGTSRVLIYRRGDERARWELSGS